MKTPDELRAKARAAGDAWLRGRMPTGVEPSADLYRIVDGMSEAMASAILPELDARIAELEAALREARGYVLAYDHCNEAGEVLRQSLIARIAALLAKPGAG